MISNLLIDEFCNFLLLYEYVLNFTILYTLTHGSFHTVDPYDEQNTMQEKKIFNLEFSRSRTILWEMFYVYFHQRESINLRDILFLDILYVSI